jgi:Ca-activated chloride channel family protein
MNRSFALAGLFLVFVGQEPFQFRIEVNQVYVDAFVSRDGAPVTNLTAENFEVFDDGKRQYVELVDASSVPHSIALLVDNSASISGRKREYLRQALGAFVSELKDDDEFAVLTFAERTVLEQPLRFERPGTQGIKLEVTEGRATALNDAIFLALGYLRGAAGRPMLVIFTDGNDNASWIREERLFEAVRGSEVVVYAVQSRTNAELQGIPDAQQAGADSDPGTQLLRKVTKLTGGRSMRAARMENLAETYHDILSEVSTRYLLVFSPPTPVRPGWHDLRVKARGARNVEVRARAGYVADP